MLGLGLALVQASVPMLGARRNDPVLMDVGSSTALAQFAFVATAFAALTAIFSFAIFLRLDQTNFSRFRRTLSTGFDCWLCYFRSASNRNAYFSLFSSLFSSTPPNRFVQIPWDLS